MHELVSALDDTHLRRPARGGPLQHCENGGGGVRKRLGSVSAANASRYVERGEEIAGAVRADWQFWRAHAPGSQRFLLERAPAAFDSQRLDLSLRRILELGRGYDDGGGAALHQRLRFTNRLLDRAG